MTTKEEVFKKSLSLLEDYLNNKTEKETERLHDYFKHNSEGITFDEYMKFINKLNNFK